MNDIHTHAFPSDPAGYQPQQGLTKREYLEFLILAAIMGGKDPEDVLEIGDGNNGCATVVWAARLVAIEYFKQVDLLPQA